MVPIVCDHVNSRPRLPVVGSLPSHRMYPPTARSQLHFATRDWLRDHGELPSDKRMESELLEPKYGFDPRVRFKVEGKDEIKKRLQRSPDRGDSVMLAIYSPMKMRSRKVEQPRSDSRWSSDQGRGY
jgi:hypothetical protein